MSSKNHFFTKKLRFADYYCHFFTKTAFRGMFRLKKATAEQRHGRRRCDKSAVFVGERF